MTGTKDSQTKRSFKLRFVILTIFFLLVCWPVKAFQKSISSEIAWFDYHERSSTGRLLNREQGMLGGAGLSFSHQINQWYGRLNTRYLTGQVDYDGMTQLGQPHQTDTRQSLFNIGLSFSYSLPLNSLLISPQLAVEHYEWRRSIQPKNGVSGLLENYQWALVKASLVVSLSSVRIEAGINKTTDASMQIEGSRCFPSSTVYPKSDLGWFVSSEVPLISTASATLIATGGFSRWSMGASDSKTANSCIGPVSFHEPDNQTDLWSMGLVLTY